MATFAVETPGAAVPDAVRHEGQRALVNVFGTALAGCRDPALDIAARVFGRFNAPGAGQAGCSVIGRAGRMDARHAASLNAMAGNVFDFDDTHLPTIIHPSAPVAPALLALAETRPRGAVSGREWLDAFAIGVEVACRIGNAVSPGHYDRGWHITATCGVFGAAAGCARLLGLDAQRTRWALGHASAQAGGLVETLGSMSKSIGVGNAAANGLLSALLAAEGFEGPAAPLEGARGFLHVTAERPALGALIDGLGAQWQLQRNTYKPYPCGVVLNPVIEACLALHAGGARLADVAQVELRGHPLLRARTDRPPPRSGREAQVSAAHAVAVALAEGRAGLDEFSDDRVARGEAAALAPHLRFVDDAGCSVDGATVHLTRRDGRVLTHHVDAARGSLARPLSDAELERKLADLAAWGGSGVDAAPLAQALWSLHTCPDAGTLMRLACPPADRDRIASSQGDGPP
ncbi:MAG: MmgE/PrpD family protein [Rubrivivax sp.]